MNDTDLSGKIEAALRAGDSLALEEILTDVMRSILSCNDFADRKLPALMDVAHDRRMIELGGSLNVLLILQQELKDAVSPRTRKKFLPCLISLFKRIGSADSTAQLVIAEILGSCYGNREALEGLTDLLHSAQEGQEGHVLTGFDRLCGSAKSNELIKDGLRVLENYVPRCPKGKERQLDITISTFKGRLRK